jgi:hypothetical protein
MARDRLAEPSAVSCLINEQLDENDISEFLTVVSGPTVLFPFPEDLVQA